MLPLAERPREGAQHLPGRAGSAPSAPLQPLPCRGGGNREKVWEPPQRRLCWKPAGLWPVRASPGHRPATAAPKAALSPQDSCRSAGRGSSAAQDAACRTLRSPRGPVTVNAPLPAPYPSSGNRPLRCSGLHQGVEAEPAAGSGAEGCPCSSSRAGGARRSAPAPRCGSITVEMFSRSRRHQGCVWRQQPRPVLRTPCPLPLLCTLASPGSQFCYQKVQIIFENSGRKQ